MCPTLIGSHRETVPPSALARTACTQGDHRTPFDVHSFSTVHPVLNPKSSDVLEVLGVPRDQQGIVGKSDARDEHIGPAHLLEVLSAF